MAPPLLPARHYGPTRPVTEDTPPDLLEGTMDLHVTLPSEKTVLMNVHRSTPMMDLLIQVTTAHRIAPGGHIIQVLSDNIFLSYKPSTPIGTLDTCAIKIVPKNKVNEAANMRRKSLQQQAQERNVRLKPKEWVYKQQLVVNLPRNQLAVYRVPPRILISEILRMVCKDKHLDEDSHEIRHPVNIDERLRGSCSLTDYQLQEICVVSKDFRAPPLSVTDLITMTSISHPEDKKRRGFLGFFSRKPKSSTGDSSVSSGSAGERSVSPARSDESAEGHPVSCALSPVSSSGTITNHLNGHHNKSSAASTSSQNQSTNSLASSSSSSARLSRPVSMMSLAKTRKRPAPIPPSQIKSTTNMDSKAHSSKEIKNSLSRNGSASSDTHTQELNTSPTNTLTSKANSLETLKSDQPLPSNLTQMNSSSMSSISSKSKRRAPAPPKLPIKKAPSAIPEEDCEQLNNTSDASSSPVVDSSVESNTISYDKQISLSSHSDSDPPSSETVMNSDDCSGDSKRNTNSSIETVSPSVDDIDSSVDETETPLKASIPMESSMENHEDETPSQSEELNTNLSSCEPLYDEINEDSRIPPSRHKKLRSTIPEERRSTDLSSPTKINALEEVIIEQKPCKEATEDFISNERSDSPCSSKNFDRVDERDEVFDVSGILKVAEEFFKEEGSANSLSKSNLTEAINPNVVDNDDRKTVEELIEEYVDEALILEDSKPIKYNLVSDSNDEPGTITTTEDCAQVTAVENSIDAPTQEFGIDASDANSADANAEYSTDLMNIQNHIKKDYTSRVHLSFDEFAIKKPVQRSVSVTRITNNASPITENNNNNNEGFVKENLLDELKSTIIDNDPKIVNLKPKLKDWNGNKNDYNVILSFENTNPIRSLNALDRTDSLSSYESFQGTTRNVRSSTESSYESAPPPLPETSVPKLPDYPELGSLQSSSPELLLSDLESRSSTLSRLSECPSSDSRTSSLSKKPLRESPIPPSESRCSTLSRQTIPESSEISEPRSSSVSRQSSFSDCDRKEFSKPRSPATTFSISTYKSRAERLSYDKKLVRSESLTSFNDIQKDIIAPSSPDHVKDNYQWKKLNRSDSQRNEIYRSDEAINKRCVIRMNRDFVPNHSSPEQIEESDESSEPEQSPPKDIPEDFKSRWAVFEKKSMSTNRLQDTPKRDYMPTKEAKGINDSYHNLFNLRKTKSTFDVRDGPPEERLPGGFSAVPDSGLNSEYMRLQDDFVKWQQQLLQNQHVLHSRVAPIATNPPTVSAMGNAHSGGAQKKPMEINIPIRFEGSDEIIQPRTKQPSPPSRTSNANHQMPNSFGQPDKVPFGNASSWNSSPSVQVGAWQERPQEQRVLSEGYNGRPNQTFTSSNEDPTMFHSPLQQGYQQQPHSLQQGYQPKIIQQGYQPQNVQQGYQQQNVQQGYQPPNVQQGYQPPNVQQRYQPPNVQQGYQPPNVQQGYQPPNVQQGYQPQNGQQGYQPQNGHKGYRTQNIQPSQNPHQEYQPQNLQQGFQLQNSQQNYQPQIMKQEPQPPIVQPQYKSNSPPSHVNPTARKPQANVQQPKYQQPQSQPKQPLANVEKQNASKPTSFGREPKTDDNINARFTSVVTLNNDQNVPQKDKVRSIVQLNNTEPSPAMAPILRASNEPSSSFNSKIIKNSPQSSSSTRERRSPSSSSEVEAPMSFRLVQQATQQQQQQPNKSAERNSSPKYSSPDASRLSPPKQVIPDKPRYSPPKPMMPEEPRVFIPKQMSPPVPNISRVSPSTEGMPPPPPPPPPSSGNMPPPPPPPPMCDRRTSTGKKIIPSSAGSTNELDAREELMMAIRNFGGSNRLRKSQNVPHH